MITWGKEARVLCNNLVPLSSDEKFFLKVWILVNFIPIWFYNKLSWEARFKSFFY